MRICVGLLLLLALPAAGQTESDLIASFKRGEALKAAGRYADADAEFQRTLSMVLRLNGEDHPNAGVLFHAMAESFERQSKWAEAEQAYTRSVRVRDKTLGVDHADTATELMSLGLVTMEQGKLDAAGKIMARALAIREKIDPDAAPVADALNDLAVLAGRQGKPEEAERLYRKSLIIRQKTDGPDSSIVAQSLSNLGLVLHELGRDKDAEDMLKRSLEIREKAKGADHPLVAESLNNLAVLCRDLGRYAESEGLYKRALEIREAKLGRDHARTAATLGNLAMLYQDQGKYAHAEAMCLRVLAINGRANGPDHPSMAEILSQLAALQKARGVPSDAERLYRQALTLTERGYGPNVVAEASTNLAVLLEELGRPDEAEPLYRRALAARESLKDARGAATTMIQLGRLELARGKPTAAVTLFKQAVAVREKAFNPEHPAVADALDNLSAGLLKAGDPKAAEAAALRGLAIKTDTLGKDHEAFGDGLVALAAAQVAQDKRDVAAATYRQALEVYEEALGKGHPHTAEVMAKLTLLIPADEARKLRQRSLQVLIRAHGADHPAVQAALGDIAGFAIIQKQYGDAANAFDDQRKGAKRFLAKEAAHLTDAERRIHFERDGELLAAALRFGAMLPDDDTREKSAEWLINAKGAALEARTLAMRRDRDVTDPAQRLALVELHDLRLQEAALSQRQAGPAAPAVQMLRTAAFKRRRELETQLAGVLTQSWVELDDVKKGIPADGVFIDIARIGGDKPKYAAWVVTPEGKVTVVPLGDAAALDAKVASARNTIAGGPALATRDGEKSAETAARAALSTLADQLLKPLLPHVEKAKTLVVCPDDKLWDVPWAALPMGDGYLVEKLTPRLVHGGRDLLPTKAKAEAGPSVVVAAVDYNAEPTPAAVRLGGRSATGQLGDFGVTFLFAVNGRLVIRLPEGDVIGSGTWWQSGDSVRMETATSSYTGRLLGSQIGGQRQRKASPAPAPDNFRVTLEAEIARPSPTPPRAVALPWTRGEAESATIKFNATPLTDARATEAAVKAASSPKVLILATHANNDMVLLAGATRGGSPGFDDGLLTLQEATALSLAGTELVVLSACDGSAATLRQGFRLAGAANVLSTLWPLPDNAAGKFLHEVYGKLGDSPAATLADAQREAIAARRKSNGAAHPYLWATYTLTGRD